MKTDLKILIGMLFLLFIIAGCKDDFSSNLQEKEYPDTIKPEEYSFIETITYRDENSTTTIKKDKKLKTASIEMEIFYGEEEYLEFKDITGFITSASCGMISQVFFTKYITQKRSDVIKKWSSQEFTIVDDSPPEEREEIPGDDPLEGYTINEVKLFFKDKTAKTKFSECTITGASESDINIIVY